jgi:N-acetylneuraminate synthase
MKTLIIAEAGVNHNGELKLALALVDAAADVGADVVKFQTFNAAALASKRAPKADYQVRQAGAAESQLDMLRRLQLSEDHHRAIIAHCERRGVAFLSSPFDFESLRLLVDVFGLRTLKFGSGELTNAPLLLEAARSGRRLILSTGMSTLDEIREALGVLAFGMTAAPSARPGRAAFEAALNEAGWAALRERVTLLHCTTEYPAPVAETNLRAMDTMAEAFGLPIGYSDHTEGAAISVAAVARGAVIIEKHLTLDRTMAGPDHAASAEPAEFKAMVEAIRNVELALGDGVKQPGKTELRNRPIARKSLVAARPVAAGRPFTVEDLAIKRPATGRAPIAYWDTLGEAANRAYAEDEPLDP